MRVLGLFDGLGGARIALHNLGIFCYYYGSEIDKYCLQISNQNYPDIIQLGDAVDVKGSELPSLDLIVSGTPCQDLSVAKKKREGLKGDQSILFYEFARVLEAANPRYFLFENVASMKNSDREIITDVLEVEPIKINSALLTAQNRERLYWTNIDGVEQPQDRGLSLVDVLDDGVDDKYDVSVKGLQYMNRQVADGRTHWDFRHHSDTKDDKSKAVVANFKRGVPYNVLIDYRDKPVQIAYIGKSRMAERIYSPAGKSVCLRSNAGGQGAKTGMYVIDGRIRRLTPTECERLQGIPSGYTAGVSDTQRYKMVGNSFTVPVIEHILSYADLKS